MKYFEEKTPEGMNDCDFCIFSYSCSDPCRLPKGKHYTNNYMSMFAAARNLLNDDIEEAVKFLLHSKKVGHKCTLSYLAVIASYITAYNELSQLGFFAGTKYFYK